MLTQKEREAIVVAALIATILVSFECLMFLGSKYPERLPVVILITFACVVLGTFLGILAARRLP